MRKSCVAVLLGVCLLGPGCSFVGNIARNLVREPRRCIDDKVIRKRAHRLAWQAWDEMVKQYGDCFSDDYRDGFIDGFVDYLIYGGCGGYGGSGADGCVGGRSNAVVMQEPIVPAVPPARYTHARYATPQGYRAVEEWFMGFRHGAATAQASGLRTLIVVPVFNPPVYPTNERRNRPTSTDVPPAPGDAPTTHDTLPTPRPVPGSADPGPASLVPGSGAGGVPPGGPITVPGAAPNPGVGPDGRPAAPPGGRPAAPPATGRPAPGGPPGL